MMGMTKADELANLVVDIDGATSLEHTGTQQWSVRRFLEAQVNLWVGTQERLPQDSERESSVSDDETS